MVALLAEGVDRNLLFAAYIPGTSESPSSRRAWIEILQSSSAFAPASVALLAEGVDRNNGTNVALMQGQNVALLAEGVDRNPFMAQNIGHAAASPSSRRAWIEISASGCQPAPMSSPSSRRAWIEIPALAVAHIMSRVALLAEGVDRNYNAKAVEVSTPTSPSSQRAWIEIGSSGLPRAASSRSPSSRRAWIEIR